MLGWYQVIITILHKWIKTIITQTEGYGCHTCQYIHHYTPLTSWLYLSRKLRMPQKIEDELANIYVNCLWLAEMEMNRKRTLNTNELETPLICCIFSRRSQLINEWTSNCFGNDEIEQTNIKQIQIRKCLLAAYSAESPFLYCPNEQLRCRISK